MKFILILFLNFFAVVSQSGTGGTSGGSHMQVLANESVKMARVWDCNGGETGTECRWILFRVRPASPYQPPPCTIVQGESFEVPCPNNDPVIPAFFQQFQSYIQKLNMHQAVDQELK